MCCIERETRNLILKFREIFPWEETVLGSKEWNPMKSRFSVKFMQFILRKMVHVVNDRYFPLFLKGLKIFLAQCYHW